VPLNNGSRKGRERMYKRLIIERPEKLTLREYSLNNEISYGEAIVRIDYMGICGSDLHVLAGKHPFVEYPVSIGHKVVGTVLKSKKFEPGTNVVIKPSVTCGKCFYCTHNMSHLCEDLKVRGFQYEGLAGRIAKLPESALFQINTQRKPLINFTLTEPLSTATHAGKLVSVAGKNILVIGLGTIIGILTAAVVKHYGAKNVIGIDINPWKLEKAKEFGFVSQSVLYEPGMDIRKLLHGELIDVVFEAVSVKSTINTAFDFIRKSGSIIVLGVFSGPTEIPIHLVQDREIEVKGALMYTDDDFSESIHLIENNIVDTSKLISKIYKGLENAEKAFEYARKEKNSFKTIIELVD